jgi:hypothetical protein
MKHIKRTLLLVLLLALAGCAESGTAPQIQALQLTPESVTLGTQTSLSASYEFTDPDGDALETLVVLRDPSGAENQLATPVSGASGLLRGRVSVQLVVLAPTAGEYSVTVTLRDAEGNDSNALSATFDAS